MKRRVEELEDRLRGLERKMEGLELDWTEVYSKIRRNMSRMAKSAAVIEKADDDEQNDLGGVGSTRPGVPGDGASSGGGPLSPRQKQIQQAILKRRAGGLLQG